MPTRNINLTAEQDAFVEEVVRSGKYQNASEAVRDAVHGWQERLKADESELEQLRRSLDAGLADLDREDYEEVDDAGLEAWLDRLADPARP